MANKREKNEMVVGLAYWATPRGERVLHVARYQAAGGVPIAVSLGARVSYKTTDSKLRTGTCVAITPNKATIRWD
jgi:hypothetical protein